MYTGDGITTKFSLVYNNAISVDAVYLDGVLQNSNTYTVNITQLSIVFNTAPASKVNIKIFMTIFNSWGVLTIGAERIMYRYWDAEANTVSGLLRGTGGTAATSHASGATVYNLGQNNLLPMEYQDHVVSSTTLADGTTTTYTANINLNTGNIWEGSTLFGEPPFSPSVPAGEIGSFDAGIGNNAHAVEVYVGGILQINNYTITAIDPVTVVFVTAPDQGVDVVIAVRQGLSWYQRGIDTASNGVPLQETDTIAARFLRGL
jgi:hypothetical protein